jgi:uncharacterized protein
MNLNDTMQEAGGKLSALAQKRMLGVWGEPLFQADWLRAVFIHYEVDAEELQRAVPFELDLYEGRAFVSLVAFTMRDMRPCVGGKLTAWLFKPIATHEFLNVRAYVRHHGEPGIHFLAEWLNNPVSVHLGPTLFGLPYRLGRLTYQHRHEEGKISGTVTSGNSAAYLAYQADLDRTAQFRPCEPGSLDEFLMERYTAFTKLNARGRFFRIWHPPWPQAPIEVDVLNQSLLTEAWPWFWHARLIGANYSPGIQQVWMGRPLK